MKTIYNKQNPWTCGKWVNSPIYFTERKKGLRLHYNKNIDEKLKLVFVDFSDWMRKTFEFPVRVNVYLKEKPYIVAIDGDHVSATFWGPFDRSEDPYIKVSTGDYYDMVKEKGVYNAVCSTISSLAHELTHYYQWLNEFEMSEAPEERQAKYYSEKIVYQYLEERGDDFIYEKIFKKSDPWISGNRINSPIYFSEKEKGLRLHYNKNIDKKLKLVFIDFSDWMQNNFEFPVRINVYLKEEMCISDADGNNLSENFIGNRNMSAYRYIYIYTGDYYDKVKKCGAFNAVCDIIEALAYELTYYFQWLNKQNLSEVQKKQSAKYYSKNIVYKYLNERGYEYMEMLDP